MQYKFYLWNCGFWIEYAANLSLRFACLSCTNTWESDYISNMHAQRVVPVCNSDQQVLVLVFQLQNHILFCFLLFSFFFFLIWGICLLSTVAEHGGQWWQQSCEKHSETWWCGELFPLQNSSLLMSLWWTKQKWEIWFQLKLRCG